MPPRLEPTRLLLDDVAFLKGIDRSERLLAKLLALVLGIVTVVAAAQIGVETLTAVLNPSTRWVGTRLTLTLGHLLDILIALEVLQNITSYLRRGVVQIELVLATAITAVARKVIVLPPGSEDKPQLLISLGFTALFLTAAWWLVQHSLIRQQKAKSQSLAKIRPARSSQELGRWPRADAADAEQSTPYPHG
jgi:uncharacterized membrane protein (DUF373 family)